MRGRSSGSTVHVCAVSTPGPSRSHMRTTSVSPMTIGPAGREALAAFSVLDRDLAALQDVRVAIGGDDLNLGLWKGHAAEVHLSDVGERDAPTAIDSDAEMGGDVGTGEVGDGHVKQVVGSDGGGRGIGGSGGGNGAENNKDRQQPSGEGQRGHGVGSIVPASVA